MTKSAEILRNLLLDAVIDGEIGKGIVVSVAELKSKFFGKFEDSTLDTFLSNSELGALTSGYHRFTIRISKGLYRIHPTELLHRMRDRKLV